ncbi:MAG TPA: Crp/Fnr family transcriptional regulator [Syntrophorhabdaceae bacterium]|jgi:CRP/FNR family transcriptional regulator/CRP/FNR family cyclic AMP-dependent transcriptional regulator|nr:Crp/Fnr family transcriptional regulator [Syntrophorhabdaceae bacterium]HNT69529.1 Crp/Fnr family transcriptional regulator [Syntrophorhabdaceae bacterium]
MDNLRNVSLFATLNERDMEVISKIIFINTYAKGEVIFQEGEKGDSLYIVLKGQVKVCLYDEDGREYILAAIGKDGFFGELALIDELPRSANVITLEDSELLIIRRHDFTRLLMENPTITIAILKVLSRRLREADERIKWLAFLSVEGRVLKYLLGIGEKEGVKVKDYIIIEKGPTQIDIASSCGCSRETVSRMVKSLVKKGILSVRKRQYTLNAVPPSF